MVVLGIVRSRLGPVKAWSVLGMVVLGKVVLGMVVLGSVGVKNSTYVPDNT
jgi:hypothetical protein